MSSVEAKEFQLPATDGYTLAATLYPTSAVRPLPATVMINSATGVLRGFYDKYARFLAEHGLTVLTYDYRGIGGSRPARMRGFQATMREWGEKDMAGAIRWVLENECPARLLAIGHSVGGQLLGLAPNNDRVAAMLAVGAQSGYWNYWPSPRKYLMAFLWHVFMPGTTGLFSYFPAKRLRLHEDLPAGVALEWARWCRNPQYFVDEHGTPIRQGFQRFRGPIRSYSFEDDGYAPRDAVEFLIHCYENAPQELKHLTPKDLGVPAIGHFGLFRDKFRDSLWVETLDWLDKNAAPPAC